MQKGVELFFGLCGGVGVVKHVTTYQKGIRPLFFNDILQPVEKMAVFGNAVKAMKIVTKMPIGGM